MASPQYRSSGTDAMSIPSSRKWFGPSAWVTVFLIDPLSIARRICSDCRDASIHLPCAARGHATDETVTAKEDEVGAEGVQQSLF